MQHEKVTMGKHDRSIDEANMKGLMSANNRPPGAIEWFSNRIEIFDDKYRQSQSFRDRYKTWTALIEKYSGEQKTVLDIGCGTGILSLFAAKFNSKVIGVDASERMIAFCRDKQNQSGVLNAEFLVGQIDDLPQLQVSDVDVVICSSVLEYVEDLDRSVQAMFDVMKAGGILLVSMPNAASVFRRIEPLIFKICGRPEYYGCVKHVITLEAMKNILTHHGSEFLESGFFSPTPMISFVLRRMNLALYSDNLFVLVYRKAL